MEKSKAEARRQIGRGRGGSGRKGQKGGGARQERQSLDREGVAEKGHERSKRKREIGPEQEGSE